MSLSNEINARTSNSTAKTTSFGIFSQLLIWNNAWREYYRLQKLDEDALRDMGLSEKSRASVTVSQIFTRMRG